jgi:hypothetical protein
MMGHPPLPCQRQSGRVSFRVFPEKKSLLDTDNYNLRGIRTPLHLESPLVVGKMGCAWHTHIRLRIHPLDKNTQRALLLRSLQVTGCCRHSANTRRMLGSESYLPPCDQRRREEELVLVPVKGQCTTTPPWLWQLCEEIDKSETLKHTRGRGDTSASHALRVEPSESSEEVITGLFF